MKTYLVFLITMFSVGALMAETNITTTTTTIATSKEVTANENATATAVVAENNTLNTEKVTKFDGSTIALKASTMGAGLEYTHPLTEDLSISLGLNKFSYDTTMDESDVSYDATIDLSSVSLLANYNPFSDTPLLRNLRVRLGAYNNDNKFNMKVNPTGGTIEIDGSSYDASGTSAKAVVDFEKLSPYFGIGWGSSNSENAGIFGMNISFDIGVIQSKVNAKLTGKCTLAPAVCSNFNQSIANENADLQDALKDLDLIPVIALGLSYSF